MSYALYFANFVSVPATPEVRGGTTTWNGIHVQKRSFIDSAVKGGL